MNPWDLSASDLLVWGIVLHLIADWPLQNSWMANNKMKRRVRYRKITISEYYNGEPKDVTSPWWDRHPSAYIHAGIHGIFLTLVFGWVAIPLAVIHLIIDTRVPIVWWGTKVMKQPMPTGDLVETMNPVHNEFAYKPVYDLGLEVLFWRDQVFHIFCVAIAALLITL